MKLLKQKNKKRKKLTYSEEEKVREGPYLEIAITGKMNIMDVLEKYFQAHYEVHKNKRHYLNMRSLLPYARGLLGNGIEQREQLIHDLVNLYFFAGLWYAKLNPTKVKIRAHKSKAPHYIG